jgi:hypothetical protein
MPSDLESSISYLGSANDPASAYFSFTVDETGEYGIIKANKEGLRLYAAELLKKSLELEEKQDGQPLFFGELEWVISDAGYDLIAGVVPQYQSRGEILAARNTEPQPRREGAQPEEKDHPPRSGCLTSILFWIIGGLIFLLAYKVTNLHLWENIH